MPLRTTGELIEHEGPHALYNDAVAGLLGRIDDVALGADEVAREVGRVADEMRQAILDGFLPLNG